MWNRILHPVKKKKSDKDEQGHVVEPPRSQPVQSVANRPRSYTTSPASTTVPPQYIVETRSESPPPILAAPITPVPHLTVASSRTRISSPPPSRTVANSAHSYTLSPPQPTQTYPFIPHHQTPQRSIPMAMDPPKISLPPPPRRRPSRSNIDSSGKKGLRRTKSTQSMLRSHGSGSPKAWNADPEQVAALHNATIMASGGSPLFPRKTTVSMTGSGSGEGDGTEKPASSSEASTLTPHQGKKPPEGWI